MTGCGDIVDSAASLTWRLRRERKAATTGLISLEGLPGATGSGSIDPPLVFQIQLGPQYKPEHQKFRGELPTPSRTTDDNVLRALRLLGWPQEVQFREAMVFGLEVCKFHKYRYDYTGRFTIR